MSTADLLDPTIDESFKCAAVFTRLDGSLAVDWEGFCYKFHCYACDSGPTTAPVVNPCPATFNGERRVCVAPGVFVSAENLPWNPRVYFNNPTAVWLAIIFSLLVAMAGVFIFLMLRRK